MGKRDIVRNGPLRPDILEAEKHGCVLVRNSRTGHPKLQAPNGKKFTLSSTPCKRNRAVDNQRADLRRWLRKEVTK